MWLRYVNRPTSDEFVFYIKFSFITKIKINIVHTLIAFYEYILLLHFQSWTAHQTSQTVIMRCVAQTVVIRAPAASMLVVNTHAQKVVSAMRDL